MKMLEKTLWWDDEELRYLSSLPMDFQSELLVQAALCVLLCDLVCGMCGWLTAWGASPAAELVLGWGC